MRKRMGYTVSCLNAELDSEGKVTIGRSLDKETATLDMDNTERAITQDPRFKNKSKRQRKRDAKLTTGGK